MMNKLQDFYHNPSDQLIYGCLGLKSGYKSEMLRAYIKYLRCGILI